MGTWEGSSQLSGVCGGGGSPADSPSSEMSVIKRAITWKLRQDTELRGHQGWERQLIQGVLEREKRGK